MRSLRSPYALTARPLLAALCVNLYRFKVMDDQTQNTIYQIQTMAIAMGDGMGTHISIYLTIISAYLIVSYLAADKLTTIQISIATGIYVVAYTFQCIVLVSYFRALSMAAKALTELSPDLGAGFPQKLGSSYIGVFILVAGLVASLWFMWSVRRGDAR